VAEFVKGLTTPTQSQMVVDKALRSAEAYRKPTRADRRTIGHLRGCL